MFFTSTYFRLQLGTIRQRIIKVPFGVIGSDHDSNLGMKAVVASVTDVLNSQGKLNGFQTIHDLEKWPKTHFAIVVGDEAGAGNSLEKIAARYKDNYRNVALIGINLIEEQYSEQCLELIRNAAYVSVSNIKQAKWLSTLTGRKVITCHPNIAFSSAPEEVEKRVKGIKKLLINVLPLYGKVKDGALQPLQKYHKEKPILFEKFHQMHVSYKQGLRRLVKNAINDGFEIETIPFSRQGVEYGYLVFDGLPVKHNPYKPSLRTLNEKIRNADWMVTTSFYSTLLALKAGAKLTPIAYKVEIHSMLADLGVDPAGFLTTEDFINGKNVLPPPISYNREVIKSWGIKSREEIEKAINSLTQS